AHLVTWGGAGGSRPDDREIDGVVAVSPQQVGELSADVRLPSAFEATREDGLEGAIRGASGSRQRGQLRLILDRAQERKSPTGGNETDLGQNSLQPEEMRSPCRVADRVSAGPIEPLRDDSVAVVAVTPRLDLHRRPTFRRLRGGALELGDEHHRITAWCNDQH